MVSLNRRFLMGDFRGAFIVEGRGKKPVETIFKLMLDRGFIDGLLTCSRDGDSPKLILKSSEVELPSKNTCFGVNSLLKRAIQKYRFSRLAVYAPACSFDGLNKTQYFGIGCNWTKTAISLKVGFLCPGLLTKNGFTAEVTDIAGKPLKVERFYFDGGELFYRLEDGTELKIPPSVHHYYTNSACRYCLNMAAKGTDITSVDLKDEDRALLIVRSERGWSTLAHLQKAYPGELLFRKAEENILAELEQFLKEKVLLNIADIVERVELGLPVPKWSDNKLRKFYRLWNSVDINFEEEVF